MLWTPVALGVGIASYFVLNVEPPLWAGILGLLAMLLVMFLTRSRNEPFLAVACLGVALVCAGFSAAQWRTASVAAPVLSREMGPTSIEGRIITLEFRLKGARVTLDKPRIGGLGPDLTPQMVRIVLTGTQPALQVGDWIRVRAMISPPPPPAAPGAFDFQRRLYFSGIGAVGFSYGPAQIKSNASVAGTMDPLQTMLGNFSRLRIVIGQRLLDAFGKPDQVAVGGVIQALMTGARGAIPKQVLDDFRDSGIAHLLAISGLHIGLVAGFVFVGIRGLLALFQPLALSYPIKKWAALVALVCAFCYALIAGATVPTMRAFLMIGVVLLAVVFERRGLSLRLIAFAASVILLIKPESLLGASFQLSFAAVTALVAVYEALSESRWNRSRKGKGRGFSARLLLYIGGVALTTLIAGAATAPYAAFHFNRFVDFSLVTNLLAVPLTALWIMPWAVVAFVLMPFGLEHLALVPMGAGVGMVIAIAREVASWPGAVTLLPAMEPWALASITLGGLWLCLWAKSWRWLGLSGIAAGLASLLWVQGPDILIDGKGRLLALKNERGQISVSSLKTAKFTRNIWLRRAAQDQALPWSDMETANSGPLTCDPLGCLYRIKGQTVALVRRTGAIEEDCRSADLLIASVPVRIACANPRIVIDRFDLWRNGTHAFWFDDNGSVNIQSVNESRGKRPWVHRPTRRKPVEKAPGT
ncbi:MAG: ComEC/Rec2 family competence protein [Rhodospirillales bacterium]|nr:ComEC/Rec2 family competence protein [Rhodospirillales bacterium]